MNGKHRWIPVRNVSGEEIPARAAMEPVSRSADGYINVTKPNINDSGSALINGDHAIPVNAHGFGSYNWPIRAKYNTSETPAVNGQSIGTRAGYWELYPGYEGFLVWGMRDSGTYVVQRNVTCRTLTSGAYGYLYGSGGNGFCCKCRRFLCGVPLPGDQFMGFPASITGTITATCIGTRSITMTRSDGVAHGCNAPALTGGYFRAQYVGSFNDPTLVSGVFNICDSLLHPAFTDAETENLSMYLWCCSDFNPVSSNDQTVTPSNPLGLECNGNGIWYGCVQWTKVVSGTARFIRARSRVVIGSCSPLVMSSGLMTATCDKTVLADFCEPCTHVDNRDAWTDCDECVGSDVQMDFNE